MKLVLTLLAVIVLFALVTFGTRMLLIDNNNLNMVMEEEH